MASTRPDARSGIPEGVTINDVETASDDAAQATRLARQHPRRPPEWLLGTGGNCAPASADGAARAGVTINDIAKASNDAAQATKATRLACKTENTSNSNSSKGPSYKTNKATERPAREVAQPASTSKNNNNSTRKQTNTLAKPQASGAAQPASTSKGSKTTIPRASIPTSRPSHKRPPAHLSSHAHAPRHCKHMRCTYQQLPARADALPTGLETTWTHAGTHAPLLCTMGTGIVVADQRLTLPCSRAATRTRPNTANARVTPPSNCPHVRTHSPQVGRPPGPTGAPCAHQYPGNHTMVLYAAADHPPSSHAHAPRHCKHMRCT
jgi:hypothetical protein